MVHTHLKNESARFQEESCFVHHHLGPCFLPLHPSASVSFKILYPVHVGGEFGRQTPSLVVLPHARNQTGKENNLCHPQLRSDTALVGHRKGLETTRKPWVPSTLLQKPGTQWILPVLPWGRRDKYYDPPKRRVPGKPPGDAFGTPEGYTTEGRETWKYTCFPKSEGLASNQLHPWLDWDNLPWSVCSIKTNPSWKKD